VHISEGGQRHCGLRTPGGGAHVAPVQGVSIVGCRPLTFGCSESEQGPSDLCCAALLVQALAAAYMQQAAAAMQGYAVPAQAAGGQLGYPQGAAPQQQQQQQQAASRAPAAPKDPFLDLLG
jgi:hypothetical protein